MTSPYLWVTNNPNKLQTRYLLKVKPILKMYMISVIIYHRANLSVPSVLYWIISPVYSRICRLHAVTQLYEAWAVSRYFFKILCFDSTWSCKVLATQLSVYRCSKVPVNLLLSSSLSEVTQHPQETDGVILKDTHTPGSGCLKKLSHSDPLVSSSVK